MFVPRRAVLTNQNTNSSSVFVVEGDTARLRVVQLSDMENDEVRIVSGVNGGELVATSNVDQLFDGVKVIRQ